MQAHSTRQSAASSQPPAQDRAREQSAARTGASLARHAAAARELPFSALFYWVD